MVAAEYVGGCTVTFMALQVRALISLPSQPLPPDLDFFSNTMAFSCSDYCARVCHAALRRQSCTWAAAAVL
jgi:hypothetical protein